MKQIILFLIFSILTFSLSAQDLIWVKQAGGAQGVSGTNIATDASGNVYTRGSFFGTVDFDPGDGVFNLTSQGGIPNNYILKMDMDGNFVWAKHLILEYGAAGEIRIDSTGAVLVLGLFDNTADFDPGSGVYELTSAGQSDVFILKLDTDGNFIWAKQFKNTSFAGFTAFTIDAMDNIYTFFDAYGTVDLDPGNGTFNLTSTNGNQDGFISKLDASGNFVWAKQFNGGVAVGSRGVITTDTSGNLYLAGNFGFTVDFDPGTDVFNLVGQGIGDGFVVKLDTDGNFDWAKQFTGSNRGYCRALKVSNSGDIYVAGMFFGTVDFDPGTSIFNLSTSEEADSDFFFCKLDNSGNFIWAKQLGGTASDEDYPRIAIDGSGNLYTTGYFEGTLDFDPGAANFDLTSNGSGDIFISILDASGNFVQAINIGGSSFEGGEDITIDSLNNICVTGSFGGTVDFDPSANSFDLLPVGSYDAFTLKLSPVTLDVSHSALDAQVLCYPNPSRGNFIIDLGKEHSNVSVEIETINGQIISSSKYPSAKTIEQVITGSAGIYFVNVATSEGTFNSFKIIKN